MLSFKLNLGMMPILAWEEGNLSDHAELDAAQVEELVKDSIQDIDPEDVGSPALKRLLEDVREDSGAEPHLYNRSHNRHNRGR